MSMKILIVDDSNNARTTLKAILEEYDVHEAESGVDALELAYTILPHIIIMDDVMPGVTGSSVLKMLKENPKTKDIPIVMTSDKDSAFDLYRFKNLGASDFLPKPFKKEKVLEILKVASIPYFKHCLEKELDSSNRTKSPVVKI